jgi:Flp pilus assembly protein TadB
MRVAVAVALTFAIATAVPQSASASGKSHHHPVKTSQTKKPPEQYLRSASPDPEHAQR